MSDDCFRHNKERFRPRCERFRPDRNRFRKCVEKREVSSPAAISETLPPPLSSDALRIEENENSLPQPIKIGTAQETAQTHWTEKTKWITPKVPNHPKSTPIPPELKAILEAFSQNKDISEAGARKFARIAHLGGLLGVLAAPLGLVITGILWFNLHGNGIISKHCKESLNFQISAIAYRYLFGLLNSDAPMAFNLFFALIIVVISGKAAKGGEVHYPFCLRLIK